MNEDGWTAADVPDQSGKTMVITGANSGIGFEAARVLAQRGARLVMAVRRLDAGEEAAARLRSEAPGAEVFVEECDLGSLDSVAQCSSRIGERVGLVDVLINNAGIMAVPFGTTVEGHERQFGTNHLGHFALTGRLLPRLLESERGRVVTVASDAYRFGRIDPENLDGGRYLRWGAYGRSKLANLLFAYELDRKARGAGAALTSVACHPGYAATNLQGRAATRAGQVGEIPESRPCLRSERRRRALPTLRAATDPAAEGGSYFGPAGRQRGPAVLVRSNGRSHDIGTAGRLWDVSEQLTGIRFHFSS